MARLAYDEGMLLDVASGGEMHVAVSAGVPANALTFHGNNKSVDELRAAITSGVRRSSSTASTSSIDSMRCTPKDCRSRRCSPRITPGVHAHTHEFIATGQDDSKFGFNLGNGDAATRGRPHAPIRQRRTGRRALPHRFQRLRRVQLRQGSGGDGRVSPCRSICPNWCWVAVSASPTSKAKKRRSITQWGNVLLDACAALGVRSHVSVEPGRAIVADAAITVYTVGTIKHIPDVRTYVAVDGGMSDNPRPVLYGSGYEAFLPGRRAGATRTMHARLVGKHCESGDVLIFDALLPDKTTVGDVLATPVTGAYGRSMASNYNMLTRPPVVFVGDGRARAVVRRETSTTWCDAISSDRRHPQVGSPAVPIPRPGPNDPIG